MRVEVALHTNKQLHGQRTYFKVIDCIISAFHYKPFCLEVLLELVLPEINYWISHSAD